MAARNMSSNPQLNFRDANTLHLTLVSAENLPCFRRLSCGRMKVYAEVSLDGGTAKRSSVDSDGETNPTWNFSAKFPLTESTCRTGGGLVVKLYFKRTVGHTFIGEVKINVESLFKKWLDCNKGATERVEGTLNGRLNITYCFEISG